ncbi:MAG: hypothetical protein H0W33_09055 [Gammaproteobacteria bacterium]|nr:hypothetical protein [Gammaproteobacteria bacterium]
MPQELLPDLKTLFDDPAASDKHYGIDGSLRSLVFDEDRNGIISGNDRVYLYFGMRRGGDTYYALDVTDKASPQLMWIKDGADYAGLGQTWSTPLATRVDVSGAAYTNNDEQFVLIFGGGYDTSQDNEDYSADSLGNGIYMVDAVSGALLWRAGGPGSGADMIVNEMENAIPGDVRVIDLNQDGFADRMYAADMGGRVFRFDVFNGQSPTSLVTGGMFATLGAADLAAPPPLSENRRFYNSPDVSLVNSELAGVPPFLNIAIGSGYRAHPLNTGIQDRFYGLRDPNVFTKLTQPEFDAITPITDAVLDDVTSVLGPVIPPSSRGWKINLAGGEKVLAEARTFDDQVFFTSLTPLPQEPNSCLPKAQNRLYVVDVLDGSPVTNLDGPAGDEDLTLEDRSRKLEQGGIAPEVVFLFPEYDPTECPPGETCEPPPPECLVGVEKCEPDFTNAPVRTFWRQDGAE